MQDLKQAVQRELIEWRRAQALSMFAKGKTMTAIADYLKVDIATISRDLAYLREEAKTKNGEYIADLPFRHRLSITALDDALSELWTLYEQEKDVRTKKSILDSIADVVIKQQIVLGDPAQIDRALKAVARIKKQLEMTGEEEKEVAAE